MPLDPLTGQVDYGGASYDPQNINASIGMRAAARADVAPGSGVFDILESLPGITTAALFNARRYAKTLEKGGRFDVAAGTAGRKLKRAKKYGALVGDRLAAPDPAQFIGGGRRGPLGAYARRRIAQGKTPLLRASRANNLTANLGAVNRLTSLGALAGDARKAYTPMQGISGIMDFLTKSKRFNERVGLGADFNSAEQKAYSGGVLGRIASINRVNTLDSIIARGAGTSRFSQARHAKAVAAKKQIVANALKVAEVANPVAKSAPVITAGREAVRRVTDLARLAGGAGARVPIETTRAAARAARISAVASATADVTAARTAMATEATAKFIGSEMTTGVLSNRITSFFGGATNYMNASATQKRTFGHALRAAGFSDREARMAFRDFSGSDTRAAKYVGGFRRELAGGIKQLQIGAKAALNTGAATNMRLAGLKVFGSGVVKGTGAFMPGLNVLATGQLIYDLAKGAGKIAVKGVNFAKDAVKSMQGTINKPMFGSGFKDNEVAATSRSRGVMAIQNSRLNARSLLGSEASMLAAHFG